MGGFLPLGLQGGGPSPWVASPGHGREGARAQVSGSPFQTHKSMTGADFHFPCPFIMLPQTELTFNSLCRLEASRSNF